LGEDGGGADAAEILAALRRAGLSPSQAAREAAAVTGLPRSELYALARQAPNAAEDEQRPADGATPSAGEPEKNEAER
jgi:hypothetical protein